ncbi:unnamed protein product [Triticum turgidum subsp. durum]|uniref:Uncharacterized protein n=1 Tax=Triticum turgidum subsp. durum TaxID=4567 RepID=A0A9R0Y531_TRITD|nr:unnamed protein product [Triticum turgidum subsp. durum]
MEEAQRCEEGSSREAEAALQLGPAGDGPLHHRRRHQRFLQGEQARRRRLRPRLQGRAGRRRGDRGEAAVGAVAAGRGGVPERGGADRQAAAPEPGEAAGVLRGQGREDARLRVPPQPEPRRLPLRYQKDRALGLEDEAEHRGGDRARAAVPPRGLVPQDRPQGPQGQQRAPRQQDEPQDLRLRHGHDLRGRGDRGHQHRPRRRNIRVHGARVRDGGRLLGEVGRVQLRGAGAGDPQRPAQRRNVPPGAPAHAHPRAWRMWSEDKAVEFMDASLAGSYAKEEAWRCYHAGLLCVQESPELRPTMSSVVLMLIGDQAQLPAPEQPPLFASPKKAPASDQSSLAVRSETTSKTHSVNDVSITMIQPR